MSYSHWRYYSCSPSRYRFQTGSSHTHDDWAKADVDVGDGVDCAVVGADADAVGADDGAD